MIRRFVFTLIFMVGAVLADSFPDFSKVADKATPAVLSIRVESYAHNRGPNKSPFQYQDPFNFFHDDFWNRFFKHHQGHPRNQSGPQQIGQGSGFMISQDGYVLTNNHVVANADKITVIFPNGRELDAELVGTDPTTDVAVVKVKGERFSFLKFADSDGLRVGQWVVAIGNPLGLQTSLTVGVLSAKGRNTLSLTEFEDFLQTDAAINKGNSGGPLLNTEGEVIGMNTAIATSTGGYMGIGFAIPSNMAKNIAYQLMESGSVTRGFIGIMMQEVTQDLADALDLKESDGALVADVIPGSPADRAGLIPGDVILRYNGQKVTNISRLKTVVGLTNPGDQVKLGVLRDGRIREIQIEIADYDGQTDSASEMQLGFSVESITRDRARQMGDPQLQGVIIREIKPGSGAQQLQLRVGDVIVAINGKRIADIQDYDRALSQIKKGSRVLLLIRQGRVQRFVSLKAE